MHQFRETLFILMLVAAPLLAQTTSSQTLAQKELETLTQAQQALSAAEQAGARTYAATLFDEASWRIRFAQENWNHAKAATREQARLRALEGLWASRAALAKANWLGTNAAIRSLQSDITRLGGRMDVTLAEESPSIAINRGNTSKARIGYAQSVLDQAKSAAAEQFAADDLRTASGYLESARKVVKATENSDTADYLSYVAEMMVRRAYYLARTNESARHLAPLQLERTRLAQSESERQAAAERAQREQAERQAAELQRQLQAEQANRQAQAAELDRLRQQVEENRRMMMQRVEQDRAARIEAERKLDEAFARHESAVASGNPTDIESSRRAVEDLEIALRTVQERERLSEQAMAAEIERLRGQATTPEMQAEVVRRQAELEAMRRERETDLARRMDLERQHQAALTEAQRRRQEAEAQAELLRKQIAQAQQAAQQASQAAQQAAQQAQQTQAELEKARQDAAQREQQRQAEIEKARQQALQAQAELEKTRQELARREEEEHRAKMQEELAKLAKTRSEQRGLIVTLPGIFFDTGKAVLKPGAKKTLSRIAAQLKGDASIRISVEGHTDSIGKKEANRELSQKRAEAVREFLVSEGVAADHVSSAGKGESEPIATNKTAAGRQQNRRVELVITHG